MATRLLAIGDLHLGRRPGRVDRHLDPGEQLTPAAAWSACVETAITGGADAVVLTGDVVEDSDDLYEAYPDLARGVRRLDEHGIAVAAVSGNHDGRVLPRLADAIPAFRLLGREGRWERAEIAGVELLGWSFPGATATDNPLRDGVPPRLGGGARIGLLHCDRDQTGSRYAPVRSAELAAADADAWLLGHIHAPDALAGPRPMGYLGSAMGLDPGEPGPRGPWWISVRSPGHVDAEQVPLAPLRWEPLGVDATGIAEPEALHARTAEAVAALHDRLSAEGARPRAVGCRLRVTGRPEPGARLEGEPGTAGLARFQDERDGIRYFVEGVRLATEPALDLERLAQGSDPLALLARRLLILRRPADDPERAELIRRARPELEALARRRAFWDLEAGTLDETRIAEALERASRQALDALLAQGTEATP